MAYNEALMERIRELLADVRGVEEKKMFRGITFMVKGKMCISVGETTIMCRIDPDLHEEVLELEGCRPLKMKGRTYRGFVNVDADSVRSKKDLSYWVTLCLDFNKFAKASKKKLKAKSSRH